MKISTRGRYALIIMIYLAKNYESNNYITLKEISEKEDISLKYLEKIMALLTKAKLVETLRGASGGYRLNKIPEEYSVLEIIKASEGPIKTVDCDNNCTKKDTCISKKLWCDLDNTLNEFFDNKTLKDLL
jgi:Rrf2 family protein